MGLAGRGLTAPPTTAYAWVPSEAVPIDTTALLTLWRAWGLHRASLLRTPTGASVSPFLNLLLPIVPASSWLKAAAGLASF